MLKKVPDLQIINALDSIDFSNHFLCYKHFRLIKVNQIKTLNNSPMCGATTISLRLALITQNVYSVIRTVLCTVML